MKKHENFSIPVKAYTLLTVRLGEAKGQSRWSVVFPSLYTSSQFKETAQTVGLNGTHVEFICTGGVEIRFRIVEFTEKLSAAIRKGKI